MSATLRLEAWARRLCLVAAAFCKAVMAPWTSPHDPMAFTALPTEGRTWALWLTIACTACASATWGFWVAFVVLGAAVDVGVGPPPLFDELAMSTAATTMTDTTPRATAAITTGRRPPPGRAGCGGTAR